MFEICITGLMICFRWDPIPGSAVARTSDDVLAKLFRMTFLQEDVEQLLWNDILMEKWAWG
jgi:hypothetical protein